MRTSLQDSQLRELVEPQTDHLDQGKVADVVKTGIPPDLERRMRGARAHFQELVLKDVDIDTANDPLSLAVGTYFSCGIGANTFPQELEHVCSEWNWPKESESDVAAKAVCRHQSIGEFRRFRALVQVTKRCVELYGLDPTTATAEDIDDCATRIKCLTHGRSLTRKRLTVHSWRSLVCSLFYISQNPLTLGCVSSRCAQCGVI